MQFVKYFDHLFTLFLDAFKLILFVIQFLNYIRQAKQNKYCLIIVR